MIDINVDESATSVEKITINSKSISHLANSDPSINSYNSYAVIKCYKSLPSITTLEAKCRNILKIHKTIFLNLSNLINIDLRENKLLKISENFKLFKNLVSLKLDYNQISYIPSFIGEFSHLETFSISNNLLSYIPTSIQSLTSLKFLNFSSNKIERLPIEFGQLNSLQSLYLDSNYFMSIPSTMCYLKKLSELSFDWLEFVDPPYYRTIKDSMGQAIINIILKFLELMLKQSILYCDFKTFIEKISPQKNDEISKNTEANKPRDSVNANVNFSNNNNKNHLIVSSFASYKTNIIGINSNKYTKIFNAIENNYYGVIKSFLESENVESYLNVKNQENKNPFYMAINKGNEDIINLFLEKYSQKKISLNYIFLFKAIRTRNPELIKKIINLGVKVDSVDDQGKGAFHILFTVFNKQIAKCALIGDFLLEKGAPVNNLDNDCWAPIHLAARKGCKECLMWIIASNKKLKSEGREEFNLNMKGKYNYTPLHLMIHGARIEETLILLQNGCDIFVRNMEAKTPKIASVGRLEFSKVLTQYEYYKLREKYENKEDDFNEKGNNDKNNKQLMKNATIDNNNGNFNVFTPDTNKKKIKNVYSLEKNVMESSNNKTSIKDYGGDSVKKGKTYDKNNNSEIVNAINNKLNTNTTLNKNNNSSNSNNSSSNLAKMKTMGKKVGNYAKFTIVGEEKNSKKNYNNYTEYIINIPNEQMLSQLSYTFNFKETGNICFQKESLLSSDSNPCEKYEAFMYIKLNKHNNEEILKNILGNFDLSNPLNLNMISDICNYIICNLMKDLIPTLQKLASNKLLNKHLYIKKELNNTISIMEKINKNNFIISKKIPKVISKSIPNNYKSDEEDDGEMFFQGEEIMNDDIVEECENDLNFEEMRKILGKRENNNIEKEKGKEKNNDSNKNGKKIDKNIKGSNVVNKINVSKIKKSFSNSGKVKSNMIKKIGGKK